MCLKIFVKLLSPSDNSLHLCIKFMVKESPGNYEVGFLITKIVEKTEKDQLQMWPF